MKNKFFAYLSLFAFLISFQSLSAENMTLTGGGVFLRNQMQNPEQLSVLNSALLINIPNINTSKINKPQAVHGTAQLSSVAIGIPVQNSQSNVTITEIVLLNYDRATGDYEIILYGVKNPSNIVFTNFPTSNGQFYSATVDVTGDPIVGRLQRKHGLVSRSDWTTGYENCAGIGQPDLIFDNCKPIFEGDATLAQFQHCTALYAQGYREKIPTAATYVPCGVNFGKSKVDRSLSGDIVFIKECSHKGSKQA